MQARRPVRLVLAVTIAAVVASACSSTSAGSFRGSDADASNKHPAAPVEQNALGGSGVGSNAGGIGHPGVDLVPLHIPTFVFGDAVADPAIQPASRELAGAVSVTRRLQVLALPSGSGTAAVDFLEISPPKHLWGEQMIPAERGLFRAFAADSALGGALVIVDDVQVTGGPDPLPMMAYRWERADVEAYAACGIPDREIEGCTQAFYMAAESVLVGLYGNQRGA